MKIEMPAEGERKNEDGEEGLNVNFNALCNNNILVIGKHNSL